jgi:hypothetical protein
MMSLMAEECDTVENAHGLYDGGWRAVYARVWRDRVACGTIVTFQPFIRLPAAWGRLAAMFLGNLILMIFIVEAWYCTPSTTVMQTRRTR